LISIQAYCKKCENTTESIIGKWVEEEKSTNIIPGTWFFQFAIIKGRYQLAIDYSVSIEYHKEIDIKQKNNTFYIYEKKNLIMSFEILDCNKMKIIIPPKIFSVESDSKISEQEGTEFVEKNTIFVKSDSKNLFNNFK
jgi:hypothetical protein